MHPSWLWVGIGSVAALLSTLFYYLFSYLLADDTPTVRLRRYAVPHDGYMRRPGRDCIFEPREKGTLKSVNGLVLRTYCKEPSRSQFRRPRGVLLFLPDWTGHMGHCALLARRFAESGFAVHGFDFSGFGESEGPRGTCSTFGVMVADTIALSEDLKRRYRDAPLFIGGQSLGALVAIAAALAQPELFKACVMLSPCIDPAPRFWLKRLPLARLAKCLPRLPLARWAKSDAYSRNLAWEDHLDSDIVLFKGKLPAFTCAQIQLAVEYVQQNMRFLKVPYHVMHGSKDLICSPSGSRTLYHNTPQLSSGAKMVLWYHLCWHGLLFEPEAEEIVQTSIQWVEDRLKLEHLARTLD